MAKVVPQRSNERPYCGRTKATIRSVDLNFTNAIE